MWMCVEAGPACPPPPPPPPFLLLLLPPQRCALKLLMIYYSRVHTAGLGGEDKCLLVFTHVQTCSEKLWEDL